ncbi:MAG TPA: DUF2252 family protein [Bacillales bacterium]|nr:DUF2252 family protein [Bacillales bacterium]
MERTHLMESTRKALRKYTITTVLNQYDADLLGLSKDHQRTKYQKMAKSPFQFFRGSAYLFYFDVMQLPISFNTPPDKPTRLQGDLHFENFGAFMNQDGEIVFDANDFDEGYVGSYLYDVFRMTASIALYSEQLGYDENGQEQWIRHYVEAYVNQLKNFAAAVDPSTFTFTETNTEGPVRDILQQIRERNAEEALMNVTTIENGRRRFKTSDSMIALDPKERMAFEEVWPAYLASLGERAKGKDYFEVKDVVKKIGSGTGSIGLTRYYVLIEGEKDGRHRDDIVLEAKEARAPAPSHLYKFENVDDRYTHQGRRVVETQRAMQYLEDPFLGYFSIDGHDFYVREFSPFVGELDAEPLAAAENMKHTVETMGKVTAKFHARADIDAEDDLLNHDSEQAILEAIGENIEPFVAELVKWALYYKIRVHEDHQLFLDWLEEEFQSTADHTKADVN